MRFFSSLLVFLTVSFLFCSSSVSGNIDSNNLCPTVDTFTPDPFPANNEPFRAYPTLLTPSSLHIFSVYPGELVMLPMATGAPIAKNVYRGPGSEDGSINQPAAMSKGVAYRLVACRLRPSDSLSTANDNSVTYEFFYRISRQEYLPTDYASQMEMIHVPGRYSNYFFSFQVAQYRAPLYPTDPLPQPAFLYQPLYQPMYEQEDNEAAVDSAGADNQGEGDSGSSSDNASNDESAADIASIDPQSMNYNVFPQPALVVSKDNIKDLSGQLQKLQQSQAQAQSQFAQYYQQFLLSQSLQLSSVPLQAVIVATPVTQVCGQYPPMMQMININRQYNNQRESMRQVCKNYYTMSELSADISNPVNALNTPIPMPKLQYVANPPPTPASSCLKCNCPAPNCPMFQCPQIAPPSCPVCPNGANGIVNNNKFPTPVNRVPSTMGLSYDQYIRRQKAFQTPHEFSLDEAEPMPEDAAAQSAMEAEAAQTNKPSRLHQRLFPASSSPSSSSSSLLSSAVARLRSLASSSSLADQRLFDSVMAALVGDSGSSDNEGVSVKVNVKV